MSWHPLISPAGVVLFAALWFTLVAVGYARRRPVGDRMNSTWTTLRRAAMGAALTIILAGPAVPGEDIEVFSNVEIFLAVDRTGSMAAEDWEAEAPRLEGVRRDLHALLSATSGSRYSIVTWDSTARTELPVTTDSSAVSSFADSLHQEISEFSAGSSLNRPLPVLLNLLVDSAESRPHNQRYLVVFSDGENTDADVLGLDEGWQQISQLIDGGGVLGYGTAEGGPMRVFVTGSGAKSEYMEDPDNPGERAISRLDEASLRELGDILGVPTLVNPDEEQVTQLGATIMETATTLAEERGMDLTYRYILWPAALVFGGLLAWEIVYVSRYLVYLRRTHAL